MGKWSKLRVLCSKFLEGGVMDIINEGRREVACTAFEGLLAGFVRRSTSQLFSLEVDRCG
jgi:hypothetical protein